MSGKHYASHVKYVFKDKKKYKLYDGDISGDNAKTKTINAAKYNTAMKTWAFSKTASGTKKVKFIRATKANLNKLKAGKITVQE